MIRRWFKFSWDWLRQKSEENLHGFGMPLDAFAVFIFIFFLANPLKWQFSGPYSFSVIFFLRLHAVVLWLTLALWRYWPKRWTRSLPFFWYLCLFYHLPFRATFTMLYSTHSPSFDSFGLLGIVALGVLVNDAMFFLLTIFGITLASFVYFAFGGFVIELVTLPKLLYACWMFFSIAFIKFIFFRNHYFSLSEKAKAYKVLAGAIAHEVRGPLATVQIASTNLSTVRGEVFAEQLQIIKQEARKVLAIIDSILSQGKFIETKNIPISPDVSTEECINLAATDPQFSASERELIHIYGPAAVVFADKQLLVQVIINIIKNSVWAVKAAGRGTIEIRTKIINSTIEITVTDTGIGISDSDKKNIFDPFFSKNKQGVGLGLAFCKLAVKNMSGTISVKSELGKQTCFAIRLHSADRRTSTNNLLQYSSTSSDC